MDQATFNHPKYTLQNDDRIVRRPEVTGPVSFTEQEELINELARYVQAKMIATYGFEPIYIPDDESPVQTSILVTSNYTSAKRLLIVIQNTVGSILGVFSRSLCMDEGLSKGSMLGYFDRAITAGYAVMVLRPNTNSVVQTSGSGQNTKVPIPESDSPETHALYVWNSIVAKLDNIEQIAFLSYGHGSILCKDMLLRQMVRSKEDESELNRIVAFVAIEASQVAEDDDAEDLRKVLKSIAINLEVNASARGTRLEYRRDKLGCLSASLGNPFGDNNWNTAKSATIALDPVFKFLEMGFNTVRNLPVSFAAAFALENKLDPSTAEIKVAPIVAGEDVVPSGKAPFTPTAAQPPEPEQKKGFFSRFFGNKNSGNDEKSSKSNGKKSSSGGGGYGDQEEKLAVSDFDLLKVVGKGAFGKVMLVKKKNGYGAGQIYAMKVLLKSVIIAKGQEEHTKSEREILCEIKHPYIVRLRFAFQSEDKLYLVTDYYSGGSLFYHLRKSRAFTEERAKFYAAQLLSALDHLHQQHIIYRDLKLENVLMDNVGHIALTDFGLSKQNIDQTGGATTFCGTAEYIAPELLKGQKYGAAVDWWSFGILLYEMMTGRTPFYDKNRKLMFYRIINTAPSFPPQFSGEACDVIRGLLTVSESERLGSGPRGAKDIMETAFFSTVDFDKLNRKEIEPPFKPDCASEADTKYVPKAYLQAQARDSAVEKKKGDATHVFEAFTYDDKTLSDDK